MLIGYRDYIQSATVTAPAGAGNAFFDAEAPVTNLQDRRLAVRANSSNFTAGFGFFTTVQVRASWDDAVPVRLVAMLGHGMHTTVAGNVLIRGYDGANGSGSMILEWNLVAPWQPPANSQFSRNMFIDLGASYNLKSLDFFYQGSLGDNDAGWFAGRWWAGPIWTPAIGTARRDFRIQTRDDSIVTRSNGGQVYVDYKARYRQLTCTLPGMTEAEAIGTDDGETQNLQDISFECGRGGEVIVLPNQSSNQVIHKFGIYGHFFEPPSVDLIVEASGRKYSSTFDVIEDR